VSVINAYSHLKKSINDLPMGEGAKIFLIHRNLIEAIGGILKKDFPNYEIYDITFLRYHNDERFRSRIKRAIEN